uniref:Uncharacterized protein n=1 Tax=Anguilla anguilla TaxID=7936 RepID=A0A0E9SK63_ANGAN
MLLLIWDEFGSTEIPSQRDLRNDSGKLHEHAQSQREREIYGKRERLNSI